MMVEHGQLLLVRWGVYEGDANESLLHQLNAWGEIHFMFLPREPLRQLPPPSQLRSPLPTSSGRSRPPGGQSLAQTQRRSQGHGTSSTHNLLPPDRRTLPQVADRVGSTSSMATEATILSLTAKGRDYPIMHVPRYDRTIFLLINGSRTISDLTYLTKRSLPAVYASLSRLREQQLIEVSL